MGTLVSSLASVHRPRPSPRVPSWFLCTPPSLCLRQSLQPSAWPDPWGAPTGWGSHPTMVVAKPQKLPELCPGRWTWAWGCEFDLMPPNHRTDHLAVPALGSGQVPSLPEAIANLTSITRTPKSLLGERLQGQWREQPHRSENAWASWGLVRSPTLCTLDAPAGSSNGPPTGVRQARWGTVKSLRGLWEQSAQACPKGTPHIGSSSCCQEGKGLECQSF